MISGPFPIRSLCPQSNTTHSAQVSKGVLILGSNCPPCPLPCRSILTLHFPFRSRVKSFVSSLLHSQFFTVNHKGPGGLCIRGPMSFIHFLAKRTNSKTMAINLELSPLLQIWGSTPPAPGTPFRTRKVSTSPLQFQ